MEMAGAGPESVPAIHLQGITKRFGAIVACDNVDLHLRRGRIHGILGENGAGKSTLMKIVIGLVNPDGGEVYIDGTRRFIRDPQDAAKYGIGMVHQHFSLVEALTVWENVILGEAGTFDRKAARQRVIDISEHYGLGVDPDARVANLPAGVRQRVEIIKCLRRDPDIIIFDEPTSVLTPAESEQLFAVLRTAVRDENKAVALISHKLDEVLHATDEITIMRAGSVVAHLETDEATAAGLARAMVGREVSLRSEAAALGLVEEIEALSEHHEHAFVGGGPGLVDDGCGRSGVGWLGGSRRVDPGGCCGHDRRCGRRGRQRSGGPDRGAVEPEANRGGSDRDRREAGGLRSGGGPWPAPEWPSSRPTATTPAACWT